MIVAKESNSILPQIEKRVPLILIGDRKNGAMPSNRTFSSGLGLHNVYILYGTQRISMYLDTFITLNVSGCMWEGREGGGGGFVYE